MIEKTIIVILLAIISACSVSCAKEPEEEVVVEKEEKKVDEIKPGEAVPVKEHKVHEMIQEAIPPTEYMLTPDVKGILQQYQVSHNTWNKRIADVDKEIQYQQAKRKIGQVSQQSDAMSIKHTLREFVASQGIPYGELENWKVSDDGRKAVLK